MIAIFPPQPNANGNGADPAGDSAGVVLQNIEVLAIAQALGGPAADPTGAAAVSAQVSGSRNDGRTEAVARPNARTATLAVTPEEAQKLILAEEKGKIRLALRGVEDHAAVGVATTRVGQLRG